MSIWYLTATYIRGSFANIMVLCQLIGTNIPRPKQVALAPNIQSGTESWLSLRAEFAR